MTQCVVCGAERERCPFTEMPLPRECLKRGPRTLKTYDIKQVIAGAEVEAFKGVIDQIGALHGEMAA